MRPHGTVTHSIVSMLKWYKSIVFENLETKESNAQIQIEVITLKTVFVNPSGIHEYKNVFFSFNVFNFMKPNVFGHFFFFFFKRITKRMFSATKDVGNFCILYTFYPLLKIQFGLFAWITRMNSLFLFLFSFVINILMLWNCFETSNKTK